MMKSLALLAVCATAAAAPDWLVGVAKQEMTGPFVSVPGMGYGNPSQIMGGLHLRLFARAFVVADPSDPTLRLAFVSQDNGMPSQAQKLEVTKRLLARFPDGRYTARNVAISGTHTHSGPSGFFQYGLFDLTSFGFTNQTFNAVVDGVVDAIAKADAKLSAGTISMVKGRLEAANINRSPSSYLENPAAERALYAADGDTDKMFVQLNFADAKSGKKLGLFNWFAVHPTSMNQTNFLVSGDHKGTAAQYIEQHMDPSALPGDEDFVAAFASTNLGDVSPNTAGPICKSGKDQGKACNVSTSTCTVLASVASLETTQSAAPCWSLGPGADMFDSTRIIAQKQANLSLALLSSPKAVLLKNDKPGKTLGWAHTFVDMSNHTLEDGVSTTCPPALGFAFAAGTTDGPGDFNFHQHAPLGQEPTPDFWYSVRDLLEAILCKAKKPTKANLYGCHAPKPVLLPTGFMDEPWAWHPNIVDVQLFRLGDFFIAPVPGEMTTMAGRRFRAAITAAASTEAMDPTVVVAGLSNLYTQYIATEEEYRVQRYEAASTLYGPHTLKAYAELFSSMVLPLLNGSGASLPRGPQPPNLIAENMKVSLLPPPGLDGLPLLKKFGGVLVQPKPSYTLPACAKPGANATTVEVTFVGANPRQSLVHAASSNAKLSGGHVSVQQKVGALKWRTVANDCSLSTRLYWKHISPLDDEAAQQAQSAKQPEGKMQHMLKMVGIRTGKTVDLDAVRRCLQKGGGRTLAGCDRKTLIRRVSTAERRASLPPVLRGHSEVRITWDLALQGGDPAASGAAGQGAAAGEYRIVYHGDAMTGANKTVGVIAGFNGTSAPFKVVV